MGTTKQKTNSLLKLDILEHGLNDAKPRYKKTKDIVASLKRKDTFPEEAKAKEEILQLKHEASLKKMHAVVEKLERSLRKAKKIEVRRFKNRLGAIEKKLDGNRGNTVVQDKGKGKGKKKKQKSLEEEKQDLENKIRILDETFTDEAIIVIAHQKLVKLAEKIFQLKKESSEFLPSWVKEAVIEKENRYNPSKFYRDANDETRKVLSVLYNNKVVNESVEASESSLKIIIGPVAKKRDSNRAKISKEDESDGDDEIESDGQSDSDSEDDSDSNLETRTEVFEGFEGRKVDFEINDDESDEYAEYDNLVIASEAESDDEAAVDPSINYDEVTDEEPSENEQFGKIAGGDFESEEGKDDFFDFGDDEKKESKNDKDKKEKKEKDKKEKKEKKEKIVLPALQAGYYSGGSDSEDSYDESKDEVLQKLNKPKKNRRGQRARQKIWEQKFGRNANHMKKEAERIKSERERKQLEYEERVRKRAAKQKTLDEAMKSGDNANNMPLGSRGKKVAKKESNEEKPMHPSWVAKRKAEKQLSNMGFQGKKVKFD